MFVGDGKINVSQLGDVLRALGQNPTEADVAKFSSQAGGGKDSKDKEAARISFDEFLPVLAAIRYFHFRRLWRVLCYDYLARMH